MMLKEEDYITWGKDSDNNYGMIVRIVGLEAEIEYFPYFDRMVLPLASLRSADTPRVTSSNSNVDGLRGGF